MMMKPVIFPAAQEHREQAGNTVSIRIRYSQTQRTFNGWMILLTILALANTGAARVTVVSKRLEGILFCCQIMFDNEEINAGLMKLVPI